ncbi:MAG: hypothetical protein WDZ91_06820 [Paenibacillaceae bacterium]
MYFFASNGFDHELRTEIADAAAMFASNRTVISEFPVPVDILPMGDVPDWFTYFYLALLSGTVRQDEIKWIPEANQEVKQVAIEAIKQHYGITVPDGSKATLFNRLSFASTEDEVKNMGFVLQGSFTDYDVYDGISLWSNEDGVEILTTNFEGEFKFLGERTMEVIKTIVYENRLSRFIREGDIVKPVGGGEGIYGYAWDRNNWKTVLSDYPQCHVYSLVENGMDYRIVAGERITGTRGYILARSHVYIGDEGIFLKGESINARF